MYKREEEVDGMVCDPLKALHQVSIHIELFVFVTDCGAKYAKAYLPDKFFRLVW